ncbi:hypothetical protein BpHYR1_045851 [Brachionus plicatilis]|uniref:Uncharacterized protein n=1 Tax=Brachionus plicatilis TaxID=10195 RepID=A0A3M7RC51_BRAPC|nr:hypothetical protein BpHYR1_045851 [Brachionus plicatilis]
MDNEQYDINSKKKFIIGNYKITKKFTTIDFFLSLCPCSDQNTSWESFDLIEKIQSQDFDHQNKKHHKNNLYKDLSDLKSVVLIIKNELNFFENFQLKLPDSIAYHKLKFGHSFEFPSPKSISKSKGSLRMIKQWYCLLIKTAFGHLSFTHN